MAAHDSHRGSSCKGVIAWLLAAAFLAQVAAHGEAEVKPERTRADDGGATLWTDVPPPGESIRVANTLGADLGGGLTVECWVRADDARAEALQTLVSAWEPRGDLNAFDAYDAGRTSGMDTSGFLGGCFDGRYVYFSPQHDAETRHGKALRYDTHGDFRAARNWQAYDAGQTSGLSTRGYYGALFDGRYVYYVPRRDQGQYHTRALRYDTRGPFDAGESWEAFDVGLDMSCQSGVFDGRHVYFCPGTGEKDGPHPGCQGLVVRYDTRASFTDRKSWTMYDAGDVGGLKTRDFDGGAFDGRYVYFVPLSYGVPLRYDTTGDFTDAAAWSAFDGTRLGMKRCVGAVFDGRHLYFCSYSTSMLLRYDTREDFAEPESWSTYDAKRTAGLRWAGYDGGFFDGRYVHFVPFVDYESGIQGKRMHFHCEALRYDATKPFEEPASWRFADAGDTGGLLTVGYNGGVYDGRYFYFAPWHDGEMYEKERRIVGHGRVLRYDTVGDTACFSLRYCDYGHNGGLGGSIPGPRFLVNTDRGVRSVALDRVLDAGEHYLAGVYDGKAIQLYVDGKLASEQPADGRLAAAPDELAIGGVLNGLGRFRGKIEAVVISREARSAEWIAASYEKSSQRITH